MKALLIVFLVSVQILMGATIGKTDVVTVIDDSRNGSNSYWGGTVHPSGEPNQDVISPAGYYNWDINSMVVTDTGTKVKVQIIGPWFDSVKYPGNNAGWPASLYGSYGSGDLYISSQGWNHTTDSPHYPTDTFNGGEKWNYVVGFKYTIVPGVGVQYIPGVYTLDFSKINFSNAGCGSLGRCDQAFYGGEDQFVETADFTYDGLSGDNSSLTFIFDKFLTGNVGLHWTMYCGNDVVEGQVTLTPEPGTLLLLGFGLVGVAFCRRKNK